MRPWAKGGALLALWLSACGSSGEPVPPLVTVSTDDDPVRGAVDAPVTMVEFIDYQSPYCQRMQPVLRRLLDEYPAHVRLVVRDFPLPVHRDAARAAEAADCAGE